MPAAGNRVPDRATGRAAARATEQYRSALRRYDPQVPYDDLIVCEETAGRTGATQARESTSGTPQRRLSEPVLTGDATPERRDLVEFCHRVAGAVFETLSEMGCDGVESAVMDAYFELAETVGDPDGLCLCLLEGMASELDEHLSTADQTDVLADAAVRLDRPGDDDNPLDALERWGLIEGYTRPPYSVDIDGGAGSVVVRISGYALSARNDRLPVLPVTLERYRHHSERPPQSVRVSTVDGGWQLTFVFPDAGNRSGLVSAPIDGEV